MGGKKLVKLLALVLVLGLCIGIYIWLDNYKAKENGEDKKEETKVIIDSTGDKIVDIAYTHKDKKIRFKYDTKKEKWYNANHKSWPTNQENVDSMANTLIQVVATRTLKTKEDLKEYGLDKPDYVIEYKTKKNKTHKFNIGRTISGFGSYVNVEGNKGIYTIDDTVKLSFEYSELDMVEVETIPTITSSLVNYVEAKGKNFNMIAEYDGDITEVDSGDWVIKKPYKKEVRGMISSFNEYFVHLESFAFSKCVAYSPKKLDKYGLDKPQLSLKVKYLKEKESKKDSDKKKNKYEKGTLTILIGDGIKEKIDNGDGTNSVVVSEYYAMIEGEERVYTIDESTANNLLSGRAFNFVYNAVNNAELTEYTDVKVKIGDDKYKIKKSRKTDQKGNMKVDYTFNGKKCDESDGDEMYRGMSELVFEGEIGDKKIKKDKTIATFEYNGKKGGAKDTTIKFLNYDDNYYRVNIDGVEYFLVSKIEVDNFLNDIKKFDPKK